MLFESEWYVQGFEWDNMLGRKQVNTIKNRLANLMEVLRSIPTSDAKKKKKKNKKRNNILEIVKLILYFNKLHLFLFINNQKFKQSHRKSLIC